MTSSNKENDSCSSDDEIHKVFRQNRTQSVISPESDDENSRSGAENKSKQKETLQKKGENDSASTSNVSPSISQADVSSKDETKPDSGQKSPKEISDGEQSEKCAICLSKFLDQQIAYPETCDHKFCSECILEWAKKMNTCPIDRLRFRYVFIQNREKPELREQVPVDEQWHRSVQAVEYMHQNTCQLCNQGENLVACIGCSRSYHAACLHMPPDQVEWRCPHCTFQRNLADTNVYLASCPVRPVFQIPFEQRNRVMADFFGVQSNLPTRLSRFLATNENDSSSEDSSDESEEELSSSTERQHQCEAVRNRRQTRYSERMRARVLNTLSNRRALLPYNPSEPFYAPNDSSDDSDYGYQDSGGGGGVVSTVPPRSASLTQLLDRNKGGFVSSTFLDYPLPGLRPMPRRGEDPDTVDNFRILEDPHPRSNMNMHAPLSKKENDVGRQHPGNPAQNSTSGSGNSRSTFPSSSSSSATSGSSLYGLFSTPADSVLTSNAAAEGYDTDASPVATHHSYGNTSQQSSSKKDAQESVHVKDIQKSHSDDEVDIYSDIEYANDENSIDTDVLQLRASYKSETSHLQSHDTPDENSLDTDMTQLQSSYKSDEPHSSPVGDGTDSSDNDLVIDEDVAAEEEAKNNADKESSDVSHENAVPGSENSCGSSSAENCEPSSEPNMPENIQSPDPSENVNHESDWPANNESEESGDHVPENKLNFEMKLYVDTDADSRDIQCADDEEEDHKDEDHSQNSFESKSENQGPKSPINDNSLSPHKDDGDVVMADGDVSTDNPTEFFQETLPTEKNEDSAIEMNSDDKQAETDDQMNETNSVHKSDDSDEEDDCDNKAEEDEKECESDDNECANNSSTPEYRSSPMNCLSPKGQNSADGMSSSFSSSKTFANSTTPFFTENPTTGLKEFPTKASLKECLPIEGEFETKEHREKNNNYQNIDLGIEDISDAASDDLNQLDNDTPEPIVRGDTPAATMCDVEKNVAKLFEPEDMESSPTKHNRNHRSDDYCDGASDDSKRYSSCRQDLIDDQEEGEIIEDIPYQRKNSHRRGHFIHDLEDYGDSAPRINVSDLPRIPKIRRETKPDIPEEPLLETKRTSVLGRVDLGQADIGWKRLSKHTRERSYRDGRPKDETVLFRERELKSRDRGRKHSSRERKNEQKSMEPERRKEDKKQNSDKSRDRSKDHSRDRRSEKSKSDHERSKSEWSYSEKRDKERHSKHKDRHDRDKTRKERHESKKDRHEKSKDKSRREDSKHRQEKLRAEDKYAREVERFHQKEESYERMYEKPREKEHKHKHKESKSDSGKKCKDEKHKRTHSREYFFEKREREVRKVDDKLKIVVEHKESRSKDRNEKLTDKRDFKHEKKHREVGHHHERKKKELSPVSYTELTPIESKEIFTKGDSIIINVNFNRASPREVVPPGSEEFNRDKKPNSGDLVKGDSESHNSKLTHSSLDSDKKNDLKCPTTPLEKNSQLLSTDEYYWQGGDETNVKSSVEEKGSSEKARSINDESSNSPVNNFGADDNVTDSEDEDNLPETQPNTSLLPKDDELDIIVLSPEKGPDKNQTFRENEEKEFGSSRRRSPLHPPSPPSPPDNDSYDPCEPTKSPSPPPPPVPPSPPLPPIGITSDRPKPPPSPELPPLPPEPEPTDTAFQEDGKSNAQGLSLDSVNSIRSSPVVTQPTEHHGPLTTESVASAPGTLLPPPRFLGHVSHQNVSNIQSQLTPSKTWQATNPPPTTVIFQSNHMQPVMPGNFLPAHIPTVGFPPPHVSATVLPSNSSIPLTSQVRHMQLGPHSVVPTNTLLPNVPMNHMTLPQIQISHVNPPLPNPSVSAAMHQQHHPVIAMQAHAGNLPNSMASHISGIMPIQNQLASNAAVTLHGNLISAHHPQSVAQLYPPQNHQTLPPTSVKEKLPKSSPAKDRSEVIDMDVDSPYSPGDSPSMDSAYDYSPPSSPVYQDNNPVAAVKDAFDSLFTTEQASGSQVEKTSSKSHSHSNSGEREHKKQKLDSKTESSKNRHHSVRLQVVDKVKSRKEHKLSERKDVLTKLDDSQLTILDELPSSAVEMQVKEKFLKKLNRQERVVEEVKLALKPYYKTREVSKEEYKDILRKSVPKICHNKSGEINPQKVKYFVDCYVKKMKHHRKKASKKRKSSKFS